MSLDGVCNVTNISSGNNNVHRLTSQMDYIKRERNVKRSKLDKSERLLSVSSKEGAVRFKTLETGSELALLLPDR